MIKVTDIHKRFGDLEVLKGVSLDVARGEVVSIVGASGAGKTTLLQIVGTLSRPDGGRVEIDGQDVFSLGDKTLSRFRNGRIGFVFQFHHLLPEFTAFENVCIPGLIGKHPRAEVERRAAELLEMMGLAGRRDHKPGQLSGGMQRRAELIRALINEPRILLMDEPFRGLDAMTRGMMQEYFLRVFESTRISMLLITSELDETVFMGDVLYLLSTMPTAIKKKMRVDLPRPRLVEHQTCPEFAEIQGEAFEVLESEALKSFEHVPGGR